MAKLTQLPETTTLADNDLFLTSVDPAGTPVSKKITKASVKTAMDLSGTNSGDDAVNSTYASDYRAANFIAGTNYLTPTGSAALLTSFPTLNQNTTGSAATLTTPRAINGVNFDGSAAITVTAAAGTLTGATLNATVTASSLTSVGTLGSLSVTGNITNAAATASTIAGFDGSKNLVTLTTATYPSLTELSYVKGVTSAIQTQLSAITTGYVPYTGATTNLALGTNSLTLTGSIASTGSRVTKGWFTNIESTNMISIGGTSLLDLGNTWTVANTWSSASPSVFKNFNTILWADQFTGADMGAKINAAYAALSAPGGTIMIPTGSHTFSTPITFTTQLKKVTLAGASTRGVELRYTGTGNAITVNNTGASADYGFPALQNFTLIGNDTTVSSTQVGIYLGGTNGAAGLSIDNVNITTFGTGLSTGQNCYIITYKNATIRDCSVHMLYMAPANNSGEDMRFENVIFSDGANSTATDMVYLDTGAASSILFLGCSFDDAQFRALANSSNITFVSCHFEDPNGAAYGSYPYVVLDNSAGTNVVFTGGNFVNGQTTFKPTTFISTGMSTSINGTSFNKTPSGGTVTNAVTLTGSGTLSWSGLAPSGSNYTYLYGTTAATQSGTVGTGGTEFSVSTSGSPTAQQFGVTGNFSRTAWTTGGAQLKVFGATITDTTSSGTVATCVANGIAGSTFAASSATTYTNASSLYIGGAPTAGTNVTITNPYSFYVNAGTSYFGGAVIGAANISTDITTTLGNIFVNGLQTIGSTTRSGALFAGAATVSLRALFNGGTSSTLATGVSYSNVIVGSAPITTFSSGTHALLANMVINPLGTVTNGGAGVTNTATLYINGAGSGGTNNYALYSNANINLFQNTTAEQIQLRYDSTHKATFTVDSAGTLTVTPTTNLSIVAQGGSTISAGLVGSGSNFAALINKDNTSIDLVNITSAGLQKSSGTQAALTIDPVINQSSTAGYTILKINPSESATGSGTKLLADFQLGSASKATIDSTGYIIGSGLSVTGNLSKAAWTTAGIQLSTVAATLTDTTSSGTVAKQVVNGFGISALAASSVTTYTDATTFYIAGTPTAGANVTLTNSYAMYVNAGNSYFGGPIIGGGNISTDLTTTLGNIYVQGLQVTGSTTRSTALFAGASTVALRALFNGGTSSTLATGVSYGNVIVGSAPITTFSSGTHTLLANAVFNPLGTVTSGGATVTETATVYISNAGSGGTNNFALDVANGNVKLGTAGQRLFITEGSNGIVGQTTLVAGTKAITISGLTTASRAFVTLVSQGGTVTTTVNYAAVCTANTLTITALTTAGATDTTDTSVVNYFTIN